MVKTSWNGLKKQLIEKCYTFISLLTNRYPKKYAVSNTRKIPLILNELRCSLFKVKEIFRNVGCTCLLF